MLQHIERTNQPSAWKTPPSTLWPTSISTIEFLVCQHLGVAPEEGAYSRDKMSDPPLTLSTSAKVAKWGVCMRDAMV